MVGYQRLRKRLAFELGPEDAADIAQESFERTLRYVREHGDSVASPVGLLVRISLNIQIDRGRRRKHQPLALDEDCEQARFEITPEDEVAGRQSIERLCAVLDRLPPRCREAFILCKLHGLSYHDAADEMGVRPSVIRQYLVAAMRICRDQLG